MSPSFRSGIFFALISTAVCALPLLAAEDSKRPRGKPIRPLVSTSGLNTITQNVVRLPGGVLLTNIPGELLPANTNNVRLPAAAARKFEPLGYTATSFTVLSRFFPGPKPTAGASAAERWDELRKEIPDDVLALNGKKVALVGFTLPLTLVEGRATEFLLLRTQSACCFGMVPRVNEIVFVKMSRGMKPKLDIPMVVGGALSIKWMGEGDQLMGLYEMQADRIEAVR